MHCLSLSCSESITNQSAMSKPFAADDPNLRPDPYASMLRESVHRFIADYRNAVTDFSNFTSIFSRLLHGIPDPPLEIVWFYSAVTFHGAKFAAQGRVSVAKDLFQLLVSCSASCGKLKQIAVLAPVVYELCNLAREIPEERDEIRSLLEGLVGFFSICCGGAEQGRDGDFDSEGDDDRGLNSCFLDVVRVWVVDRCGVGDELEAFFPIVTDGVRRGIRKVGSFGVGYLAGIVMCEAFLLRLCLTFALEKLSRAELEKDVRNWAVQMITGFRCSSFFDTLLGMLLEQDLPVASPLSHKDECLLQEVLYDSVLLVDYSFLEHKIEKSSERLKTLAVTWLLVADSAIRFVRKDDDQTKVISYISAFSESCLASHLIKWVTNQIGMEGNVFRPSVSTPVALIKWILLVEDQGVRVFDCEISKLRAKEVIDKSRVQYMIPVTKPDGKALNDSDLEMVDSVDAVSVADAVDGMTNTQATDGLKKRKGTMDGLEIPVKFVKCHSHENSVKKQFPSLGNDGGLSSKSEVDNPVTDGDIIDMQH